MCGTTSLARSLSGRGRRRAVQDEAEYVRYFLSDEAEMFKFSRAFRTKHLSYLPAESAPLLEEIRMLLAVVSSYSVGRQNRGSSGAALRRVGLFSFTRPPNKYIL
jgi:hypothetical protein